MCAWKSELPQLWLDLRPYGYSDAFRDVMRTVPGATWNLTTRSYMLPEEAWPCMEPVIRSGLAEVTSDQRKTHPALAKVLPPGVIDDALHSYQIEGAAFLYQRISATGSALLGDDPGLGKTVQAITVAKALEADRLIIIAPAVVLRHWEAELLKWWPTMCCHVLDSRKSLKTLQETVAAANAEENLFDKLRLKADLYDNMAWILSYDFLRSNEEALLQVLPEAHGVFLDEIHYIQNAKSKRSKAVGDAGAQESQGQGVHHRNERYADDSATARPLALVGCAVSRSLWPLHSVRCPLLRWPPGRRDDGAVGVDHRWQLE